MAVSCGTPDTGCSVALIKCNNNVECECGGQRERESECVSVRAPIT